ncbi:MAG: YicC/YloC family endoribonuclease [Calditrichaceae bacterium]
MRSMTGFGRAGSRNNRFELNIEIRSVNNRYLDLNLRVPRFMALFENEIRDQIKSAVDRGKVSVFIDLREATGNDAELFFDSEKLKKRFNLLDQAKSSLGLEGSITMDHLMKFQDLFEVDFEHIDEKELKSLYRPAVKDALKQFNEMRESEGTFIYKDMVMRIASLSEFTDFVEEKGKLTVRSDFERLTSQVRELIGEQKMDESRLEQEIAIIADKVDITEECIRMKSHIKLFKETLEINSEAGKKLTFILQEMLREANTMNSKATDVQILHKVIQMKEEIEKLREQAQNIE